MLRRSLVRPINRKKQLPHAANTSLGDLKKLLHIEKKTKMKKLRNESRLAGAHNLIANCGEAVPGETLLLCYEPSSLNYYDQSIVDDV